MPFRLAPRAAVLAFCNGTRSPQHSHTIVSCVRLGEPERLLRALRPPRRGAGAPPQRPTSPIFRASARHSAPAILGMPRRLAGGVTRWSAQRIAERHVEPSTRAGTLEPDCCGPIRRRIARLAADRTAAKPATRARARRVSSSTPGWLALSIATRALAVGRRSGSRGPAALRCPTARRSIFVGVGLGAGATKHCVSHKRP